MSVKLIACGDIVNFTAKSDFIDVKLVKMIQNADMAICNFEAPIKHEGMMPIKKAGPHVYQAKEAIKCLRNVGFNYVSLANNHIYDYGQRGLQETINELEKNSIGYIGAGVDFEEAYCTKILHQGDLKIGLMSAAENEFGCLYEEQKRGGYAWIFHDLIEDRLRDLKSQCDFVVFFSHAGAENIEIPIKEWRDRYVRLCDIGVDVIVGHHPHVPQGYEKYKDSWIFYSLGNFYFDTASFVNKSDDSYSVIFEFHKDKPIDFDLIYHKKINGQTCLVEQDEVSFDIDRLCNILNDGYRKRNDEINLELFNKYYYRYYEHALDSMSAKATFFGKIKWLIKKIFFSQKGMHDRNLMLLHNIRIDSHRFVVQRALSLISEDVQ